MSNFLKHFIFLTFLRIEVNTGVYFFILESSRMAVFISWNLRSNVFPRLKQKKGSVSKTWRKIIKSYKKAPGVDISKTQIKSLSFFTKALKFLAPMNTFLSSFWAKEMRKEEKKTATYWWNLNGNCTIFIGIHKGFGNFMITKSPCVILGISRISWVFRTS